ncbi:zinc finger protein 239-like [Octopus sinensis]|uniref:Zinc finger protein 239-like n=1 Tax=Octopus sinensis TaxID=2607531 RepID=A0A6P7TUB9_9MOLL|nr:zinc finger protein 239-like [Octopus sinensis]
MEDVNAFDSCDPAVINRDPVREENDGEKQLLSSEAFTKQISLHRDITDYRCEICAKRFSSEHEVFTHRQIHNREKSFHFTREKTHFTAKFVGNLSLKSQSLQSTYVATRVKNRSTVNYARNPSPIIPVLFTIKRVHTGEKPYRCDICGQTFMMNSNLTTHKRVHTAEQPYRCEICGKSFINNSHLVVHLRSHSGERPYHCDACGKSFSNNSHLVVHRRIHSGERPYHCAMCGIVA